MFQDKGPAHDTASSGRFTELLSKWLMGGKENNTQFVQMKAENASVPDSSLNSLDHKNQLHTSSTHATTNAALPATQTVIQPIELAETVGTATHGTGSARLHFIAKEGAPHVDFTYNGHSQLYPLNSDKPDVNTRQIAEIKKFVDIVAPDFLNTVSNPVKLTRADGQKHLFMNLDKFNPKEVFEWDPALDQDIKHSIDTHNVLLTVKLKELLSDPVSLQNTNIDLQPSATPHLTGLSKGSMLT